MAFNSVAKENSFKHLQDITAVSVRGVAVLLSRSQPRSQHIFLL